jgi:exo-beta-1,3-glucanase (GH17 family)
VSAGDLLNKITSVKAVVQQYGYYGPVTTAEPPSSFIDNPFLCQSSTLDLVGINAHSYFDASSTPAQCGSFVVGQITLTKNACNGKTVFVTEAGFPHDGITNGGNTPSYDNQRIALTSLFQATQGDVTFFTLRDGTATTDETDLDLWKDPGPYGVEQSWGIIENADNVDFL